MKNIVAREGIMHHFPPKCTKHKFNGMNQIAEHNAHRTLHIVVHGQLIYL